ncbi:hypothetical protein FORMB_19010 [Formosa sp. Hel1_33_131]|uniref:hypothetical protein n=1 Tax=Formosa sp. Hel1_33_131 TaxID=1336794 RepID=UPI00084E3679|nr:hypothetical protein [Formosa sp. Hel1_33_131]AOR28931.1 hypothetical protein FORMB_19010 [Formosa sp. Hel1_33_131]
MATEKLVTVKKRVSKLVKKVPTLVLVDVKTDGTLAASLKIIETLKKQGVSYFEVQYPTTGTKRTFKKLISGKSYEIKSTGI